MTKADFKERWSKFVETAKTIVNSPSEFFNKLKKEKGFRPALEYLVILWVVGSLLTAAANMMFGYLLPLVTGTLTQQISFPVLLISQIVAALISAAVGVVLSGALSIVLHLWIKVFRGKGTLTNTFQINSYALTPSMLFGWLPIANIVASIFGVYLLMVGAEKIHDLSRKKTILMFVVIPIVLAVVVSAFAYTSGISIPASN